jgi:pimeloyl-ACP methyl ester carboxylesterase
VLRAGGGDARRNACSKDPPVDQKPHLLLLPGMLCDEAFWRAQARDLADVSLPQVMAYGELDDLGAMAEAVLAAAPDRFALAGHSMGGRVAQEVFRRAPARVDRLALLATDYRGHQDEEARAAEASRREAMMAKVAAEGMDGFARMWVRQILAPGSLADEALVAEVVAMMARQPAEYLAAQTHAGLTRPDHTDMLAGVLRPTLVLAGAEDVLRPVEVHRWMAERLPQSRLVVVEGAGHMVAMERPQAVTRAMRDWLAS